MSGWKRTVLLSLEAVICFGPIGFVLLLGMLLFPLWTRMLAGHLSGAIAASGSAVGRLRGA